MKTKTLPFVLLFTTGIAVLFSNCKQENPLPPDPPPVITDIGKAQVWLTTGDQLRLLQQQTGLSVRDTLTGSFPLIQIDTTIHYQQIRGFGAALTGSSAYNLHHVLSTAGRETALKKLFDPSNGIGISYVRLSMGASDFSLSDYTYDDLPSGQTDEDLSEFTLDQDLEDVVPMLKEILEINPEISLMGSPWSPPAWMKTNNSLRGGKLRTEYYSVYANYFVKYIKAMANEGIAIKAVTLQNEPLYSTAAYPCMEMQAAEQADFVKNHLGPAFLANGIETEIVVYDHNWDEPNYPISILDDQEARTYITGSAFHAYAGNVSAMNTVHTAHPDKDLFFTEISGGGWATDFGDNLLWNMKNIFIGTTKNWSSVALLWNLVLNQSSGPTNNGCSDCRGVITVQTGSGLTVFNEEYYSLGHLSKFVKKGAVRVSVRPDQSLMNLDVVAFVNPDGSKAMVLANYGSQFQTFTSKQTEKYFTYTIAPESVATIVWK